MPRIGIVLLAALIVTTGISRASACPFCGPTPPPLAEQLAESDVAVFAEWRRVIEPTEAAPDPQTEFRIVEVLRSVEKGPEKGTLVSIPLQWQGQPGDLVLLLGSRTDGVTDWKIPPTDVTEISAAYIRQAPSPEKPAKERLPFFIRFLEAHDPLLGNDAFAEFSRAKYEDVVAIKDRLPRDKLRQWLDDPETPKMRLGFYGLLLGLCGKPEDVDYLAAKVLPPTPADQFAFGLDGQMAGYVLLTGEPGFQKLVEKKLHDPALPDGDVFAVINLLRFLWQFAADRVPQTKVAAALRPLAEQPKFAETAIIDLARWKDWVVLPSVIARYGEPPFETLDGQLKVIQYALACVKHGGDHPAVSVAQKFLDRLKTEDPETLAKAQRSFSSPLPTSGGGR